MPTTAPYVLHVTTALAPTPPAGVPHTPTIGTLTAAVARYYEGLEPRPCLAHEPHPAAGVVMTMPLFPGDLGSDPLGVQFAWAPRSGPTLLDALALHQLTRRLQRVYHAWCAQASTCSVPRTVGAMVAQAVRACEVTGVALPYVGAARGWRHVTTPEGIENLVHAQVTALQSLWAARERAAA
jgi:hypothetical protein